MDGAARRPRGGRLRTGAQLSRAADRPRFRPPPGACGFRANFRRRVGMNCLASHDHYRAARLTPTSASALLHDAPTSASRRCMQVATAEARAAWLQRRCASASHRCVTATKRGSLWPQERERRPEWLSKQALTLAPSGLAPPQADLIASLQERFEAVAGCTTQAAPRNTKAAARAEIPTKIFKSCLPARDLVARKPDRKSAQLMPSGASFSAVKRRQAPSQSEFSPSRSDGSPLRRKTVGDSS